MFDQLRKALQGVTGTSDAQTKEAEEQARIRAYIGEHAGANTRTICQKAGVQNKRAQAIIKAGLEHGDWFAVKGAGGSSLYYLAGVIPVSESVSEPTVTVLEASPEPETAIGIQDLGFAIDLGDGLLQAGRDARVSQRIREPEPAPEHTPIVTETASVAEVIPESVPAPKPEPITIAEPVKIPTPAVRVFETEMQWSQRMSQEQQERDSAGVQTPNVTPDLRPPVPPAEMTPEERATDWEWRTANRRQTNPSAFIRN